MRERERKEWRRRKEKTKKPIWRILIHTVGTQSKFLPKITPAGVSVCCSCLLLLLLILLISLVLLFADIIVVSFANDKWADSDVRLKPLASYPSSPTSTVAHRGLFGVLHDMCVVGVRKAVRLDWQFCTSNHANRHSRITFLNSI